MIDEVCFHLSVYGNKLLRNWKLTFGRICRKKHKKLMFDGTVSEGNFESLENYAFLKRFLKNAVEQKSSC